MAGDRTLLSVVAEWIHLDRDATIFAVAPWERSSPAMLVFDEVDTTEARDGYEYFLEVEIAADVLSELQGRSVAEQCDRLIQYATNDC